MVRVDIISDYFDALQAEARIAIFTCLAAADDCRRVFDVVPNVFSA